jgi:hypothetical protein
MNKKRILLAVLGVVALLPLAGEIVTRASPEAKGRLIFTGFQATDDVRRAFFTYHPPKSLKQCSFIKCQCVKVDGDSPLDLHAIPYGIPYEIPAMRHFGVVCPAEASAWRLQLVVVVKTKGVQGVVGRIRNVLIQKRLTAWHNPPVYSLAPVYSLPITNPAADTLLPRTEQ